MLQTFSHVTPSPYTNTVTLTEDRDPCLDVLASILPYAFMV